MRIILYYYVHTCRRGVRLREKQSVIIIIIIIIII